MKLPFRGISHFRTNPNVGSSLSLNQALWVKSSSGVSMVMTPLGQAGLSHFITLHLGWKQGSSTAGFPPDSGTHQKPPWLRCARICHFLPMSFDLGCLRPGGSKPRMNGFSHLQSMYLNSHNGGDRFIFSWLQPKKALKMKDLHHLHPGTASSMMGCCKKNGPVRG